MAIGKKLMVLGSYAFAASALLVICISVAAFISAVTSGQPVCLPGIGIRCHENDCGRFFQRCGSDVLLEVPAHKVCYRGILLPASRIDLYSCPSAAIANNSSRLLAPSPEPGRPEPDIPCTTCKGCVGTAKCDCLCFLQGPNTGSPVIDPITLKTYPSIGVSQCCAERESAPKCARLPMWEKASATVRGLFTEESVGQWSLQDFTTLFTFRQPLTTSDTGCCTVSPGDPCYGICG